MQRSLTQSMSEGIQGSRQVVCNGVQLVHVLLLAHGEGLLAQVRPHHIQGYQHLARDVAPHYREICRQHLSL